VKKTRQKQKNQSMIGSDSIRTDHALGRVIPPLSLRRGRHCGPENRQPPKEGAFQRTVAMHAAAAEAGGFAAA